MGGYKVRSFIFCIVVGLYLSLSHPFLNTPVFAIDADDSFDGVQNGPGDEDEGSDPDPDNQGDITIETEIGPEFTDEDAEEIQACSLDVFKDKFPLDFVQAPTIGGLKDCPQLTMFGFTHEACFIVDTFEKIEPGIIASLFILAIISL